MLKQLTFKRISITTLLLLLAMILYNYPEEINEPLKNNERQNINIYLIDENDFVAMTEIQSDSENVEDKIIGIIKSLTIGINSNDIPKGFRAVIPENTKLLDMEFKDGLLKLNFSKDFLNVSLDDENKMIEALVFSLTTVKQVQEIMIFVEGEKLNELPNSKKKLGLYLDRSYGINKVVDINTINDTSLVTIYYLSKSDNYYYIPISYVSNNNSDKIEIIINNLKSNRLNNNNLLSHLNYQVELMNYETTEEEISLNFNAALLDSVYDGNLKEEVKYAVFYSIYDTLGFENIVFMVNSDKIDEFRLEK